MTKGWREGKKTSGKKVESFVYIAVVISLRKTKTKNRITLKAMHSLLLLRTTINQAKRLYYAILKRVEKRKQL